MELKSVNYHWGLGIGHNSQPQSTIPNPHKIKDNYLICLLIKQINIKKYIITNNNFNLFT